MIGMIWAWLWGSPAPSPETAAGGVAPPGVDWVDESANVWVDESANNWTES